MARPDGGRISGYAAPTLNAARGVWSLREHFNARLANAWPRTFPLQLSSLVAWYDASDASSITTVSGNVSQWNDKSGSGLHLTQGTAGARPPYTGTINGANVITYGGTSTSHRLTNSSLSVSLPTVFVVFRVRSGYTIGASNAPLVYDTFGTGSGRYALGLLENSSSALVFGRNNGAASETATGTVAFGATQVVSVRARNPGADLWVNGTAGTSATSATNGLSGISIGNIRGNPSAVTSGYTFDGPICEVIVLSGYPGDTMRSQTERYLGGKWGVTVL